MCKPISRNIAAAMLALACATAAAQDLDSAAQLLDRGQADAAFRILLPAVRKNLGGAKAQNLLCRVYYAEKRWDEAAPACLAAVKLAPEDSNDALWAGRVLGEQAQVANPVAAYRLAHQVRANLESAVDLDPKNAAALRDLGEFYSDAPALLGGGTAKAQEMATRLAAVDVSGSHWLLGHIAESKKDIATAEREYRAAATATSAPAMAWADLASFYARQKRPDDSVTAVQQCARADRRSSGALVDAAAVLLRIHRELPFAAELVERYIGGTDLSEETPLFVAHDKLAQIYDALGNTARAQSERNAARKLASGYDTGSAKP